MALCRVEHIPENHNWHQLTKEENTGLLKKCFVHSYFVLIYYKNIPTTFFRRNLSVKFLKTNLILVLDILIPIDENDI